VSVRRRRSASSRVISSVPAAFGHLLEDPPGLDALIRARGPFEGVHERDLELVLPLYFRKAVNVLPALGRGHETPLPASNDTACA
jgi:hypothetical protein